jgi:hypothetical protein
VIAAGVYAGDWLRSTYVSLATPLRNAWGGSFLGLIALSYPGSALHGLLEWSLDTARHSWIYQWLTKEPEPDVIVIDLRETLTVGPILILLERVIEPLARAASAAKITRQGRQLAAAPIPVASAALLGLIFVFLVRAWPPNPPMVVALIIAVIAAALGLGVEDSSTALANSRVIELLVQHYHRRRSDGG